MRRTRTTSRDASPLQQLHSSSNLANPSRSDGGSPYAVDHDDRDGIITHWRLISGAGAVQPNAAELIHSRGATNMAIDQALLEGVQEGTRPALRFYQWSPACLSFGRNQTARDLYDAYRLHDAGIDVVRRPTGGLAVLHDQELTYSVIAPADVLGGPRAAYHAINAALVAGLRHLGAAAALAGPSHAAPGPQSRHPCFQEPAAGEVMAGGGKLVGSAQRCEKRTILQHGSILLDGEQASIVAYQNDGPMTARQPAGITLRTVLGDIPATGSLIDALVRGFESALGIRLAHGSLSEAEQDRARILEQQYDSDAWTWRR